MLHLTPGISILHSIHTTLLCVVLQKSPNQNISNDFLIKICQKIIITHDKNSSFEGEMLNFLLLESTGASTFGLS